MNGVNPFIWENDFPAVYGQTSVSFLKKCPGFDEAKTGDRNAAAEVVSSCINNNTVEEIKHRYPGAVLLPVITDNRLPEALAEKIGMKSGTDVCLYGGTCRKSLSAMERLLHKPEFYGGITRGERYIIIDDIITQGGTVSALRKYVIKNGGTVAAVVALSCSAGSTVLVPNRGEVSSLIARFNFKTITGTLRQYNIASDILELTRSQVKYLLRFKGIEKIIEKIEKSGFSLSQ